LKKPKVVCVKEPVVEEREPPGEAEFVFVFESFPGVKPRKRHGGKTL